MDFYSYSNFLRLRRLAGQDVQALSHIEDMFWQLAQESDVRRQMLTVDEARSLYTVYTTQGLEIAYREYQELVNNRTPMQPV
jgi:hypothetical protein